MAPDATTTPTASAATSAPAAQGSWEHLVAQELQSQETPAAPSAPTQGTPVAPVPAEPSQSASAAPAEPSTPVAPTPPGPDASTLPIEVDENHPTKLGRKVKELTEVVSQLQQRLTQAQAMPATPPQTPQVTQDQWEQMNSIEACPLDTIVTPQDAFIVDQWKNRTYSILQQRQRQAYETNYVGSMESLKLEGGDNHDRIVYLMRHNAEFNVVHTGNPAADAQINYLKAKMSLISAAPAAPTTFGKGQSPIGSTPTVPVAAPITPAAAPSLEGVAKDYADYLAKEHGFTPEKLEASQKRPIVVTGTTR